MHVAPGGGAREGCRTEEQGAVGAGGKGSKGEAVIPGRDGRVQLTDLDAPRLGVVDELAASYKSRDCVAIGESLAGLTGILAR